MKENKTIFEETLETEGTGFPVFLKLSFRAANALYKRYMKNGMDEFDASLIIFAIWCISIGSAITVVAAGLLSLVVMIVRLMI